MEEDEDEDEDEEGRVNRLVGSDKLSIMNGGEMK